MMTEVKTRRWRVAWFTTTAGLLFSLVNGTVDVGTQASATPNRTTFQFYAEGTEPKTTTPSGAILNGNDTQATGDYLIDTYKLYLGTEHRHAEDWSATVSLHCLLTALSKPSLSGTCETVLARGSSMLIAAGPETFQSGPSHSYNAPIVFGTGDWEGVTGTLTSHDIGATNDAEFVVELARHH